MRGNRGRLRATREIQRHRVDALRLCCLCLLCISLSSCEWFTDFKRQPSLWTWEPVKDSLTPSRGNPQMSVPISGMTVAGFQVSYSAFPAAIDSNAAIATTNPHPASP